MNILIACESSGEVREAFRALGHDAWSCDLLPADDSSPYHIQGDALDAARSRQWDLLIAHPPCTYLSGSGLHWNKRRPGRALLTEAGAEFFMEFTRLGIPTVIENPIGCMSTRFRKPDVIVQPYHFGEDASKATCLWCIGVPPLRIPPKESWHPGRFVEWNEKTVRRWSNQTDSGQNKLAPSADRWKLRSKTYPAIARAMAEQWGKA